jgi:hypothetical protein
VSILQKGLGGLQDKIAHVKSAASSLAGRIGKMPKNKD